MNDKMQVTKLKTWFDSDEMFRQMDPENQAVRIPMASCPVMGASTQSDQIEAGLNVA